MRRPSMHWAGVFGVAPGPDPFLGDATGGGAGGDAGCGRATAGSACLRTRTMATGETAEINGVDIYYEVYGEGRATR